MDLRHLTPDREQAAPIYLQLYQRYLDAIASGKLRPGDRVSSVRSLASALNLSRGTVELAYQMLTSEGYFLTRGPAGTVVSPRLEHLAEAPPTAASGRLTAALSGAQTSNAEPLPFQLGLPALDAFPRKTWARLASHNLRSLHNLAMSTPDPAGYQPLRRAIATYLGISRGIACSEDQVFVTIGYRGALELMCQTVLHHGDVGWHEDPGYHRAREFLTRAGMHLEAVPVDEEGLNLRIGLQRAAQARFAVVTPTHQSPMGMALSLPRRLELLEWARQRQAWIIEDDYDSEFRYLGRPLPALKSLDRDGRVLYTGTFSKVLFPGLRLAYLVVPTSQVKPFSDAAHHLGGPGAILLQATVADFMEQGHFVRHLRKMRSLYALRRGYLVEALAQVFDMRLSVQPQAGGIHVLAMLAKQHRQQQDNVLAAAARSNGLAIDALSHWRMRRSSQGGLLMGFANLTSAEQALEMCHRLMAATRKADGRI